MSEFVQQGIPYLWEEIFDIHWKYLNTEESIAKLEDRKKLEDSLKDLLCVYPHDHKFLLPQTAQVLKDSVSDLENFNAQKGIAAFESISQYANNLFTKPWRKEFRILKLYSGFYQHEIKSNLFGAVILFEAMGYRRLSENTLVFDGPLCTDQVANVSRDAMIAYVELQIIKHIYTALDTIGVKCSWLDIYRYREKYSGSALQVIKALANSYEEKRFRSAQKVLMGDNYGYIDVQPSSNYFATNTKFCPAQCQCYFYQQVPPVSRQRPIVRTNGVCCVSEHSQQSPNTTSFGYNNMAYPPQFYQHNHQHRQPEMSNENGGVLMPHMSHSRSLEHYSEPKSHFNNLLPHRHSFDHQQQGCTGHHQYQNSIHQKLQQQHNYCRHLNQTQHNFYESPYDCIDGNSLGGGSSTISYADVTGSLGAGAATVCGNGSVEGINCNLNTNPTYYHPYNVSGNRVPLPLNISNQFSSYDNPQSNSCSGIQEPTYSHVADHNIYSSISKLPQNSIKNANSNIYTSSNNNQGLQNPLLVRDSLQRQRSCQTDQLINFEDPITPQQQFDSINQYRSNYETSAPLLDNLDIRNIKENPLPISSTSICQQHFDPGNLPKDDTYGRKKNALNARKYPYNTEERDISCDSANDDFGNQQPCQEKECNHQSSPTQLTKNQDGVGSIEQWNHVYKNLEKNDQSKDVGERKEFLLQSLDLDSLNINNDTLLSQTNSVEKRRSFYSGNENKTALENEQQQQSQTKQKAKAFETSKYLSKTNSKTDNFVAYAKPTPGENRKKNALNAKKYSYNSEERRDATDISCDLANDDFCSQQPCHENKYNQQSKPENLGYNTSTNKIQKQKPSVDTKKTKIMPKQTNSTSKPNTNKLQPKSNDNKTLSKTMYNNNNVINPDNESAHNKKISSAIKVANKPSSVASTQIVANIDNEWKCEFCTLLNPISKRICEMCFHSRGFKLESSASTTASGATSVAHNTPTCV